MEEDLSSVAAKYLMGGVSSSFRRNPFTGEPFYVERAEGPYIWDIRGRRYIDFFMGHGACPLGHKRPEIVGAVRDALDLGLFAEHDGHLSAALAQKIVEHVPCAEKVRYTNSGSEATLLCLRLARGYTGRDKIVRIDGHFHGVHDYVLCNNLADKIDAENPGDRPSRIGDLTAGIPQAIKDTLYVIPWNRADVFEALAREKGGEIAAIIMNPIDYNNGCITTSSEYLEAIRETCDRYGILLIFDEVLSGFRTGLSCAQGYYGVTPDLCALAKALTNGFPLAAVAGKDVVMQKIMDPRDPVIAGGTFSGNLLGCAAGLAAFGIMEQPGFYDGWRVRSGIFLDALQGLLDKAGVPARVQWLGPNFFIYFGVVAPVTHYAQFSQIDRKLMGLFFTRCIEEGLYFHTDFTVSAQHTQSVLDEALSVFDTVLETL
ncbi:MAG TPA: aminotransferase class III-fold pyridoxal phosphate-dependent enzyme [Candidatus Bathyarchaeia archaeon]|nr:aminotransferase class III-fold pyridoxal phosphate-dependent enzyme [Candidatus Bathyarchaeia archaeon]